MRPAWCGQCRAGADWPQRVSNHERGRGISVGKHGSIDLSTAVIAACGCHEPLFLTESNCIQCAIYTGIDNSWKDFAMVCSEESFNRSGHVSRWFFFPMPTGEKHLSRSLLPLEPASWSPSAYLQKSTPWRQLVLKPSLTCFGIGYFGIAYICRRVFPLWMVTRNDMAIFLDRVKDGVWGKEREKRRVSKCRTPCYRYIQISP